MSLQGSGYSYKLTEVNPIIRKVFGAFVTQTNVLAKLTPEDLETMEFWVLKRTHPVIGNEANAPEAINYILYNDSGEIRDGQGNVIGDSRAGGRIIVTFEEQDDPPKIAASWRDVSGGIIKKRVDSLAGLRKERLSLKGVPGLASYYDDL